MIKNDIILFGKPGAGKGTLAKLITKGDTAVYHLSTGDLFRQNMTAKSKLGIEIDAVMKSGELVDDELTIAVVEDWLINSNKHEFIIFDGFPRTERQLDWLLQFYVDLDMTFPIMFELEVEDTTAMSRISKRAMNEQRPEDMTEKSKSNRIRAYEKQTADIKDKFMETVDSPCYTLQVDNLEPQKVYREFMKTITI